jgi:hypothetical protein
MFDRYLGAVPAAADERSQAPANARHQRRIACAELVSTCDDDG